MMKYTESKTFQQGWDELSAFYHSSFRSLSTVFSRPTLPILVFAKTTEAIAVEALLSSKSLNAALYLLITTRDNAPICDDVEAVIHCLAQIAIESGESEGFVAESDDYQRYGEALGKREQSDYVWADLGGGALVASMIKKHGFYAAIPEVHDVCLDYFADILLSSQ